MYDEFFSELFSQSVVSDPLGEDYCKMCEYCENESTHYNAEVASYLCDECED